MRKELKTQLITGILSCPVLYIPHCDTVLVDEVLGELVQKKDGKHSIFRSSSEEKANAEHLIAEYDWNNGFVDFGTKDSSYYSDCSEIPQMFQKILDENYEDGKILLFRAFDALLEDNEIRNPLLVSLRMFASKYWKEELNPLTTIILMSPMPVTWLPEPLMDIITVIDIKAPSEDEIKDYLANFGITNSMTTEWGKEDLISEICRSLLGLQMGEVRQILSSSMVRTDGKLSEKTVRLVLEEKRQVVRKSGIIEVVDANVSLKEIGGLETLKDDIERKATIYRNLGMARKTGLALPKGILIIGMPGCGKSMIAKAVANEFKVSLLRLDVSRLMGQYVGQSEANLRKALSTAEAAHPCVLWIDEIEKAFAGASGRGGFEDNLVMRLMGHFLTWMQERQSAVFIVATANDVMRPEFMRKGRFDDVYFVNFPNKEECRAILNGKLSKYRSSMNFIFPDPKSQDLDDIVKEMHCGEDHYLTGAEIESLVNVVLEKKLAEYCESKLNTKGDDQSMELKEEPKIEVTKQDFINQVDKIKSSAMARQASPDGEERTAIDRIVEMQRIYHFTCATPGNDVPAAPDENKKQDRDQIGESQKN